MITKENLQQISVLVTHAGVFHVDDVYSTALIWHLAEREIPVMRVNEVTEEMRNNPSALIFDIGGGEYDHHQENPRQNHRFEQSYCAYTLLWEKFVGWDKYLSLDNLARVIEAYDVRSKHISDLRSLDRFYPSWVEYMRPTWDDEAGDWNAAFLRAANMALQELKGRFLHEESEKRLSDEIKKAEIINNDIMVVSRFAPFGYLVPDHICCIVSPSLRGGWQVLIQRRYNSLKMTFPKDVCAMDGVSFVHPGGFLACTDSKETAINLAIRSKRIPYSQNATLSIDKGDLYQYDQLLGRV